MTKSTLAQQVRAELSKPENRNVIASVNEDLGTVTTCILPTPYWAEHATKRERIRPDVHIGQARPDWASLPEGARGLVVTIAAAKLRGEHVGESYEVLPRSLSDDPQVAESWHRSEAWREWGTASLEVRRIFVASAIEDLRRAAR